MTDVPLQETISRFEVRRTSDRDTKPCPEAVPGKIDYWDVRTFKSPEEHDAKLTRDRPWRDWGTDHQIIYGPRGGATGIKRKTGQEDTWFVEFNSLAGLMAFFEKYGDLVITTSWADKETPLLEIYDGWRE